MKKEIRKEVRECILSDVNQTLARLEVSENVKETGEHEASYYGTLHYEFESDAIRQMPMIFKKLYVTGYMVALDIEESSEYAAYAEEHELIIVELGYAYKLFQGGSNGCDIGRMGYLVKKKIPARFNVKDEPNYYIKKVKGLTI